MNILLLGSGGREHALAWALTASPLLNDLYCAPGNAGMAQVSKCVALDPMDFSTIIAFCHQARIDYVVVGPEAPLVAGIIDALQAVGIKAFGPSAAAAALEGSKGYMKELCARHSIPTAAFARFNETASAEAYIDQQGAPIVIKADGLAAGKGVVVAASIAEAKAAVRDMLSGRFGAAGSSVVIEEFLDGEEVSFFALTDGKNILPLGAAQDHKRVFDHDQGPNTGGMGAYSPASIFTPEIEQTVMAQIIRPTVDAMEKAGAPFSGVLFAGLMLTKNGPKLIEYNVRFGDPECQVLMRRLRSDLLPALMACTDGMLNHVDLRWRDEAALCIVMAASGYPEKPVTGGIISGLDEADAAPDIEIFHAATKHQDGKIIADGGRVLGITALGANVTQAALRAYRAVDLIDWPDGFCRRDIGARAIAREMK